MLSRPRDAELSAAAAGLPDVTGAGGSLLAIEAALALAVVDGTAAGALLLLLLVLILLAEAAL